MASAVYQGSLVHVRYGAPAHKFFYNMRLLLVDIDEWPQLVQQSRFWSLTRGFAGLFRKDFIPHETLNLKDSITALIKQQCATDFDGRILQLAAPRIAGIGFNPLTLYYCYAQDVLRFVVAEVRNTPWMERHCYVLDCQNPDSFHHEKTFHVSPFMDMEQRYAWQIAAPDEHIRVVIKNLKGRDKTFAAVLQLSEVATLTGAQLDRELFSHWPQSLKTLIGIYWQAVKLIIKGARFYAHPNSTPNAAPERDADIPAKE